jgi:hypothetical protein
MLWRNSEPVGDLEHHQATDRKIDSSFLREILHRPVQRSSKLIRVFLDFLVDVFAELENARPLLPSGRMVRVPKPEWFGRARGRQSNYGMRKGG